MKFRVLKSAEREMDQIFVYWAKRASIDVADRLIDSIQQRFEVLGDHPRMGRKCEEYGPGVLRFPAGNYVIYYRINRGHVQILHVIHGARDRSEGSPSQSPS